MGIRLKFTLITLVLFSVSLVGIGLAGHTFSEANAMREAKEKGDIIFSSMLSMQKNFMKSQRPLLLELVKKDAFIPELMSGAVITRMTWEIFQKENPGYTFKQASTDPRWPPNKADAHEEDLIAAFRADSALQVMEGTVEREGEPYYYRATPRVAAKNCLVCHGEPESAPKEQLTVYGPDRGYGWKEGEVAAAFIVYIPLAEALKAAKTNTIMLMSIGGGGLFVTLLGLWIFLNGSVVKPITRLTARTEEISLGKKLSQKVEEKAGGEIKTLAAAIERLRVSLVKIIQRAGKK